jgi:hypothetical protein
MPPSVAPSRLPKEPAQAIKKRPSCGRPRLFPNGCCTNGTKPGCVSARTERRGAAKEWLTSAQISRNTKALTSHSGRARAGGGGLPTGCSYFVQWRPLRPDESRNRPGFAEAPAEGRGRAPTVLKIKQISAVARSAGPLRAEGPVKSNRSGGGGPVGIAGWRIAAARWCTVVEAAGPDAIRSVRRESRRGLVNSQMPCGAGGDGGIRTLDTPLERITV